MEILPTKIHRIRQDADLKAAESAILQIAPAPISGKENRRLMEKFPMTAEGHAMLQNELMHRQQVERQRIIQQIADARTDDGDLAENAEYHAAQELQEANESRIAALEDKLARAEVIDITKLSGDTVKFGATVTVIDEDREKQVWKIVGE